MSLYDLEELEAEPADLLQPPQPRRTRSLFVKGPLPVSWLRQARGCGPAALPVGLMVWFLAGLSGRRGGLKMRPRLYEAFGLSRHAVYRGLTALERGGLLRVERRRGAAAVVAIVAEPEKDE